MHHTDKYSQHSSIIWPFWPNGWVPVYELSGSRFESSCNHLNFRFCPSFEQEVPWYLGNYRIWIHSQTCTWHDKNIQLIMVSFSNLWTDLNIFLFRRPEDTIEATSQSHFPPYYIVFKTYELINISYWSVYNELLNQIRKLVYLASPSSWIK